MVRSSSIPSGNFNVGWNFFSVTDDDDDDAVVEEGEESSLGILFYLFIPNPCRLLAFPILFVVVIDVIVASDKKLPHAPRFVYGLMTVSCCSRCCYYTFFTVSKWCSCWFDRLTVSIELRLRSMSLVLPFFGAHSLPLRLMFSNLFGWWGRTHKHTHHLYIVSSSPTNRDHDTIRQTSTHHLLHPVVFSRWTPTQVGQIVFHFPLSIDRIASHTEKVKFTKMNITTKRNIRRTCFLRILYVAVYVFSCRAWVPSPATETDRRLLVAIGRRVSGGHAVQRNGGYAISRSRHDRGILHLADTVTAGDNGGGSNDDYDDGGGGNAVAIPTLSLFNSKTRRKEVFRPIDPSNGVTMYTCGPTVYDHAHVGNFRAFVTYDIVKRVLTYLGYDVKHVCNLTDVDDKIIQRATERGIGVRELTDQFTKLFFQDLEALNIIPATAYPKATEHIDAMMEMIRTLRDKGLAYETPDGSWYFRTQSQPGYGRQLVQLDYDQMERTERGDAEGKEHFADFCLWKAFKDGTDRDDAAWSSDDIKKGRPGWHLECSAMARTYFGDATIDLHGGGIDLKFPHHENEIAQSEGVLNDYSHRQMDGNGDDDDGNGNDRPHKAFCNCWFHNGFVNIGDEKMSKSSGNFLTLRNACPTAMEVRAYRFLVASSQYRSDLPFTAAVLEASQTTLKRMDKARQQLDDALTGYTPTADDGDTPSTLADEIIPAMVSNFEAGVSDDLNMPRAVASFIGVVKEVEKEMKRVAKDESAPLDVVGLAAAREALEKMDQVFGIFYTVPETEEDGEAKSKAAEDDDTVPDEVLELVSRRSAAKEAKDWELADGLRSRITELGFAVKDVKGGEPIISRL